MIDRYTLYSVNEEIAERFNVQIDTTLEAQYNAAPTKRLPVIVNVAKEGISHFYWGSIAKWSNNRSISTKLINAAITDISTKSTLKNAFATKRCIVPANGFYLWKAVGKKSKRPYYFQLNGQSLFGIAGIWEDYDDLDGKTLHTFRIITTENKLGIKEFGDFMPAIIDVSKESIWLDNGKSPGELMDMIQPLNSISKIKYHPVSHFINNIDFNYPEMINKQPSIDQSGNYTLFE